MRPFPILCAVIIAVAAPATGWPGAVHAQERTTVLEAQQDTARQTPVEGGPVLSAAEEFDMGVVAGRGITQRAFIVKNTGTAPLELTGIHSSCGCTQAAIRDKIIAPGGTGVVEISVDPRKITGFVSRKRVTIQSNDPAKPNHSFTVIARVEPEFAVEPEVFDFGTVKKGETPEVSIILRQLLDTPIQVGELRPLGVIEGMRLTSEQLPQEQWRNSGKAEYRITAKLGPDISPGPLSGQALIKDICPRVSTFSVPVRGTVESFYTVNKNLLRIGRAAPGAKRVSTMVVSAQKPFVIQNLAVTNGEFAVRSEMNESKTVAVLEVDVLPGATEGAKNEYLTFTVAADGEKSATERVRLVGIVGAEPAASGNIAAPIQLQPAR